MDSDAIYPSFDATCEFIGGNFVPPQTPPRFSGGHNPYVSQLPKSGQSLSLDGYQDNTYNTSGLSQDITHATFNTGIDPQNLVAQNIAPHFPTSEGWEHTMAQTDDMGVCLEYRGLSMGYTAPINLPDPTTNFAVHSDARGLRATEQPWDTAAANIFTSPPFHTPAAGAGVPISHNRLVHHEATFPAPALPTLHAQPAVSSGSIASHIPLPNSATTVVRMDVPLNLGPTKEAIKEFTSTFKQNLGTDVQQVECSWCVSDQSRRTTRHSAKPSNLERHLFSHFGVKGFICPDCGGSFTTKDQLVTHCIRRYCMSREDASEKIKVLYP